MKRQKTKTKTKTKNPLPPLPLFLFFSTHSLLSSLATSQPNDVTIMLDLRSALNNPPALSWTGSDPCNWPHISCSNTVPNRVTRIQIGSKQLTGTLPPSLSSLTSLQVLEVYDNQLTGPVPSLSGLSSVQVINLNRNNFTVLPPDFFVGLTALTEVYLDYNPFQAWNIPLSLTESAGSLKVFSAVEANVTGKVPGFINPDVFFSLQSLHLSFNYLEGELPANFSGLGVSSLWLNGQNSEFKLNGSLSVLQNMTQLTQVWLHGNAFSGPIPELDTLVSLKDLSLRDNTLTGIVPDSLLYLPGLEFVNLTNNFLQGMMPKFRDSLHVDVIPGTNSFCLDNPGVACDPRVDQLLLVAKEFGYPVNLATSWKGNDPCSGSWAGITCSASKGNITVVNFNKMGLAGTISPNFSAITMLQKLVLSNNMITGTIPEDLTRLPNLSLLDVSNNMIYGQVPNFRSNVKVIVTGNVEIGKDHFTVPPSSGTPPGTSTGASAGVYVKKSNMVKIVGSVIGVVCGVGVIGLGVFLLSKKRKRYVKAPNVMVVHPHSSGDQGAVKITVAGSSTNTLGSSTTATSASGSYTNSSNLGDVNRADSGHLVISIQVLRNVTNNFSEDNILGSGGFGTVYKGELHDGTKIAVKRMGSGIVSEKGLGEFQSEIAVLTRVRHRHLVALLGYCLDGNEKLLVYEYMPQGTLSRFLFGWKEEGLKPLEWTRRLNIALDVARGVEYLHSLARESFIHRDLKPSNILLGDDMRAKVADFGLVRLAPQGKVSVETRLAGTFGYLAPEYAVTGRVTTKVDVFSFGVILMEVITGRKALDETQPDDSSHLVTWFRRLYGAKTIPQKAIDPIIELNEETLASINVVAELAYHCTNREPQNRPDMGYVVSIISPLIELWKPSQHEPDDLDGVDGDMTLSEAVKRWQAIEVNNVGTKEESTSSSSYVPSSQSTQSIGRAPSWLGQSFNTHGGR